MEKWKSVEPGTWKPESQGDSITGVLLSKEPKDDKAGISARYHLETETDGIMLVWGCTVLDDRMQFVKIGQKVRITYDGQTTNKRSQTVNLYNVEVADKEDSKNDKEDPVLVEQLKDIK